MTGARPAIVSLSGGRGRGSGGGHRLGRRHRRRRHHRRRRRRRHRRRRLRRRRRRARLTNGVGTSKARMSEIGGRQTMMMRLVDGARVSQMAATPALAHHVAGPASVGLTLREIASIEVGRGGWIGGHGLRRGATGPGPALDDGTITDGLGTTVQTGGGGAHGPTAIERGLLLMTEAGRRRLDGRWRHGRRAGSVGSIMAHPRPRGGADVDRRRRSSRVMELTNRGGRWPPWTPRPRVRSVGRRRRTGSLSITTGQRRERRRRLANRPAIGFPPRMCLLRQTGDTWEDGRHGAGAGSGQAGWRRRPDSGQGAGRGVCPSRGGGGEVGVIGHRTTRLAGGGAGLLL